MNAKGRNANESLPESQFDLAVKSFRLVRRQRLEDCEWLAAASPRLPILRSISTESIRFSRDTCPSTSRDRICQLQSPVTNGFSVIHHVLHGGFVSIFSLTRFKADCLTEPPKVFGWNSPTHFVPGFKIQLVLMSRLEVVQYNVQICW